MVRARQVVRLRASTRRKIRSNVKSFIRKELSWRLDPEESYSDHTIKITRRSSDGAVASKVVMEDVYYVHRVILAFGKYSSEYFRGVFQQKHMVESRTGCTCMTLDEDEAEVFPYLLDCIYSQAHIERNNGRDDLKFEVLRPSQLLSVFSLMDYLGIADDDFVNEMVHRFGKSVGCEDHIQLAPKILTNHCPALQGSCLDALYSMAVRTKDDEFQQAMNKEQNSIACILDVLIQDGGMESLEYLQEKAAEIVNFFSSEWLACFPEKLSVLFDRVRSMSYNMGTLGCIGAFVNKLGASSPACFDAMVDAGMIEAGLAGLLSSTTTDTELPASFKRMLQVVKKYPTRAPIHRFAVGFPTIWNMIEDSETENIVLWTICDLLGAICQYSNADRKCILKIDGCTPLGKALLFPWNECPHLSAKAREDEIMASSPSGKHQLHGFELVPRSILTGSESVMEALRRNQDEHAFLDVIAYIAAGSEDDIQSI